MGIFRAFIEFFNNLFGIGNRANSELKRVYSVIAHIKPPYYKLKGNIVSLGFAQDLFLFCQALKPLMNLADRTLAHPDVRVSTKYFEYLVDLELSPEDLNKKDIFTYDGMKSRMDNAVKDEAEIEAINLDFKKFLDGLDALDGSNINNILFEVERFIDICRHDWERVLGFFDPAASLEDKKYRPDFEPCSGELFAPELLDMHYLLDGFVFSEELKYRILKILVRFSPASADSQNIKIEKIFNTLNKILGQRLSSQNLLCLVQLTKQNPEYVPNIQRERKNYIEAYRKRLVSQYERDRERLIRERHETVLSRDIKELFGTMDVLSLDGYSDDTDAYLRRESPSGFTHVKAMSILKTYVHGIFEAQIKDSVKKLLVEGFFDNKNFQNNLANILFQCAKTIGRIEAFEEGLKTNSRISITALRRYVEEIRHGKDIQQFLSKLVEEINYKASDICVDETGLFQMLADVLGELLNDYKKPSPDLINNIRNIGGPRNKEILTMLGEAKKKTEIFVRIMQNLTNPKSNEVAGTDAESYSKGGDISEVEAIT